MPIIKRVNDFEEGSTFIIENVLIDYASVFKPNTRYRPEWAVVIRVPQNMIQEFYECGFRLKQDANGVVTLRSKRYVRLDDGTEMQPPSIVDCENNPWTEARGLIGNGSRCNVKVRAKYTTYQGVEGLSCFLEGLQVLDHIPYYGSGPQFGAVQGTTGGYDQNNFQAQAPPPPLSPAPVGQPVHDPTPYTPQEQAFVAPPVQPAFVPPVTMPDPSIAAPQPAFVPPPVQPAFVPAPVQQSPAGGYVQQPFNPGVPEHLQPQQPQAAPFVPPQGAPVGGNVSQPVAALGGAPQYPQQPESIPFDPNHSTGEDVPF
jgi:hypothetical protein